jgi:sortase (surface protein transpeptidase)
VHAASPSRPVQLSIPAIGVSKRLLRLGLRRDGTVEVPASGDASFPGWFRLGPVPGQVGSAVILGHVDSVRGPAVFYELRSLARGNRVDVRLEDGAVVHFEVQKVATYPNADFPARKVYASRGARALNLVTCGGTYEKENGGYQSNVVVFTRLVDTTPRPDGASRS